MQQTNTNTKRILIIGGSVAVVGTVIYLIARNRRKDEPFVTRDTRGGFTPRTNPTTNPNPDFQGAGGGRVVLSSDTTKWYPKWLPPITISF